MIEIRIHGRGGQGSVTMAELLAEASFYSGQEAQAFPNFGVERRGAPVTAYVRLDKKPIRLRSQVYTPDYIIIQDATLIDGVDVFAGAKKGTVVLINTKKPASDFKVPTGVKVKTIYATGLALEVIGRPIVNTILLGAFAGLIGSIKMTAVDKVIKERFAGEIGDKNIIAAKKGYEVIANN
jgi:pyruvate ferredoxin oxidoreductase gamma subunit